MELSEIREYIEGIPDEVLHHVSFSMPWQSLASGPGQVVDEDGFTYSAFNKDDTDSLTREVLQTEIFRKFHQNPHLNTSVRGLVGRMTGWGFETVSEIEEIQDVIDLIELDKRNRLYYFWPKYVGRYELEGELFQLLTVHPDGFIEVDFIDPSLIGGDCEDGTGVIFHPSKTTMPLFFNVGSGATKSQIPSIFIARYDSLIAVAKQSRHWDLKLQAGSKSRKKAYQPFRGYTRFIVSFDKGLFTRRAISYLRTVLQWLNHYENLKKYEIDHKKAAGAYVYKFKIEDAKAFKIWLGMTDEDKRKTGIMAKKTPGGTLVCPPGIDLEIVTPSLSTITNQDNDILNMISAGVNESSDVLTGSPSGPYSSVKATRGPMTDRVSDEIASLDRYLKFDFWSSIFFIRFKMGFMEEKYKIRRAVGWTNKNPVFKEKALLAEQLVDIIYPTSDISEYESKAKAFLGSKHGPLAGSLGIPRSEMAKKMGFGGYGVQRLRKATEDDIYPELPYEGGVDAESKQEKDEGEPGKPSKSSSSSKE